MRTRSQSRNLNRQQQQAPPAFVEPFNLEEPIENPAPPVVPMADNRTMTQLLQAPTEGYEDALKTDLNYTYETDIQEKDKKKAKNDKTEHEMEKTKSNQSQKDYTVESGEDSLKLIELMNLCTKLIDKVTILENASKETHAQTLTMLMKKVKRLEDKLKFYNTRKKARMVILDTKEYLISEDSVKHGRMEETDDP
ncbi:hypothetical protein Tco_0981899 [Tanacetum coccineum]